MTLNNLFTLLSNVSGFADRVAFDAFPETMEQTLPYINIQIPTTSTFAADNITYYQSPNANIELYTRRKDQTAEAAIEGAFTQAGIYYSKYEGRIDAQSCYQVVYSIGV